MGGDWRSRSRKGGSVLPIEAQDKILQLANQFAKCAPFALGLDGVDESKAEELLLRGLARGTAREYDMLRWCQLWPDAKPSRPRLECALLGALYSPDYNTRRGAYFSLAALAKKDALAAESCRMLADTILQVGLTDSHSGPRASSLVAMARLFKYFDTTQLNKALSEAAADQSAEVRRASGILEQELTRRRGDVEE